MRCKSSRLSNIFTRKLVGASVITLSLIAMSGCSDSDDDTVLMDDDQFVPVVDPNDTVPAPSDQSIADRLLNLADYSQLLTFIEQVDLTETLQGDNSGEGWTLFAFSDTAFSNTSFESVTDEQIDFLVRNHLYSGTLLFEDLAPGLLPMVAGSIEIEQNEDGTISVGGATIIARDRQFSNGVIHFVDNVLEPFE